MKDTLRKIITVHVYPCNNDFCAMDLYLQCTESYLFFIFIALFYNLKKLNLKLKLGKVQLKQTYNVRAENLNLT